MLESVDKMVFTTVLTGISLRKLLQRQCINFLSVHLPRGLGDINLKKINICVKVILSLLDKVYKLVLSVDSNSI